MNIAFKIRTSGVTAVDVFLSPNGSLLELLVLAAANGSCLGAEKLLPPNESSKPPKPDEFCTFSSKAVVNLDWPKPSLWAFPLLNLFSLSPNGSSAIS